MLEVKINNIVFQKYKGGAWETFSPTVPNPDMWRDKKRIPYRHDPKHLMNVGFPGKKSFVDHLQAFFVNTGNIHYVGSRAEIPACPANALEGYGIYLHECTIVTHFYAGVKDRQAHTWQEYYVIAERFRTDLEPEPVAETPEPETVVTWTRPRYFIADGEIVPSKVMLHANGIYNTVSEPFKLRRDAETVLKGEAA